MKKITYVLGMALALSAPLNVFAGTTDANAIQAVQQQSQIKGQVVDENGEPLIGVTVQVKGQQGGAITDFDGNFSLNAPANAELTFSYVGYVSQTVKASQARLIKMKPDAVGLEDVVVVGYGTQKKRDLTGAVSSVKSEVITLTPSSNAMESLQGRVAGLDITRESGQAGEGVSMQLRGNRSITASGNPLFIIDGLPGDYSALNPNDIESIEVLKDASSTAVYGSEGANGVVIITTKKGEKGKVNVNFDAYLGINGWSKTIEMNSPEEIVRTQMLANQYGGQIYDDFDQQLQEQALANGKSVDWVDALLKTGYVQNYSLSVSGGTERTQGYFSFNYSDEKGQYKKDEYKVYSTTIRLNQQITDWLSAGVHVQGTFRDQSKANVKLSNALRASPFGELYYTDAEEAAQYGAQVGDIKPYPIKDDNKQVNLLLNTEGDNYRNKPTSLRLYAQPYIRITPLKGLSLESRLSASWQYNKSRVYEGYNSYAFYDAAGTGALNASKEELAQYTRASFGYSDTFSYTWENILTYNFKIADDHEFTLTGVTSWSDRKSESLSQNETGILSNSMYWTNLGASTGQPSHASSHYSMKKTMGYVGRLNYSYLGRYLLSASLRYDASSVLAKDKRWNTFPAVSLGWRISDEAFMDNTKDYLDNLKLRASYGEAGVAGISEYSSFSTLVPGNAGLGDQTLTKYEYSANLTNTALTWERSKSWDFGIDASFFNNRIDLVADFYVTNTDGVLWEQSLPITNGGYSATTPYKMTVNIAETKNTGFELQLTGRPFVAKKQGDFSWVSTLTYSTNKEEVTSLGADASNYVTKGDYTLHVGDPIHSYYAFKIDGVWQNGEEKDAACFGTKGEGDDATVSCLQPGDLKVFVPDLIHVAEGKYTKNEVDDDGNVIYYTAENPYNITANDKMIIGHHSPKWSLGWHNTWSYKGFDLSVYAYMRYGQMFYYEPITWYKNSGGNFPAHFDYWTPDNPSNDFPALNRERSWTSQEYYTSLAYVDGSFLKIKNITLAYNLPKSILKVAGLQKLRIYGTLENPFVKAKNHLLKGYDPEQAGNLNYPLTRKLVFGINVTL